MAVGDWLNDKTILWAELKNTVSFQLSYYNIGEKEKFPDKGFSSAVPRTRIPSFVLIISLSFAKSFLNSKNACETEVYENQGVTKFLFV